MYIQRNRWRLSRRTFLEAAGVSLALPWLEAMGLRSGSVTNAGEITTAEIPRRAYFSHWGFFNNRNIPTSTGRDYTLPAPYKSLQPYQNDFTLFTGMRGFTGGHAGCGCLLTGMNAPSNNHRLVSVDQQIASFYQGKTRVPSLVLGIRRSSGFGSIPTTLSWTANRTPITPENQPEVVFNRLFRIDDEKTRASRTNELDHTTSVLDLVRQQARALEHELGKDDRATLDQYFTSIRDIEERLKIDRNWIDVPPPKVTAPEFGKTPAIAMAERNDDGAGMKRYLRLMFDVIALAFQTDSTRVVAHYPKGEGGPTFKDRTKCPFDYHTLTHHGEDVDKLRLWSEVDAIYMEHWAYFLGKLKSIKEGNGTLLDHTMAAWATTQGDAGHSERELPLMLCGGAGLGLKHQGHLATSGMKIGSVWQTMVDRVGMPLPRNFQGGQSDGLVKEVL
jgi:hypothetical protein